MSRLSSIKRTGIFMTIFSILMWIIGFVLGLVGLNLIAEIIETMVWLLVVGTKFTSYLKNPKVLAAQGISSIIGLIPLIGEFPFGAIGTGASFIFIYLTEKKKDHAQRMIIQEQEEEQEREQAAVAYQMYRQQSRGITQQPQETNTSYRPTGYRPNNQPSRNSQKKAA